MWVTDTRELSHNQDVSPDELFRLGAVARDGFDCHRSVARGLAFRGQTQLGVWMFLLSNFLWVVWGFYAGAYALIILQVCLAALNIRGAQKNDPEAGPGSCSI